MNTENLGAKTGANQDARVNLDRAATIGRYLVIGLVGKGGMGEVYAAYDPELDRKVALKLLRAQSTAGVDPSEGRARLLREAQAIARLSDPNVVVVFDVGTFQDRVFLAMEFVDGSTLGYWLQAEKRAWRDVVATFIAAGRGLACAHRAGVVHRDFKPDNVMIGRDGKVRVMDFGLARSIDQVGGERVSADRAVLIEAVGNDREASPRIDVATALLDQVLDGATRELAISPTGAATANPVAGLKTSAAPSALESRLTESGAMMGTPAYMAAEQFRGRETIDARTDQFSFCVALYEGLYGERPFAGKTIDELTRNVLAGNVKPPPPRSRVPSWVRRALLRGLRPDPAGRYATMEALLSVLGRDPAHARRRWLVATAVLGIIALLGTGLIGAEQRQRRRCAGADAKFAGIWELPDGKGAAAGTDNLSPRKRAIRDAFVATGKRFAADSFSVVRQELDRYVVAWSEMYRESCEATHVRGEQSAEVLDLRTACLNDRVSAVRALTDVFREANADAVTNSVQAVQTMRPIEPCADVEALRAVVRPPDDPESRRVVAELRSRLADLKAAAAAGRFKQAQSGIVAAVTDARRTRYEPLIAEALVQLGTLQLTNGDVAESERNLEEAVLLAESSRHDEIVIEAETNLIFNVGNEQRRYAEAELWARHAKAVLDRLGPGHDVMAGWRANNLGVVLEEQGRFDEALATQRTALKIKQAALGARHFDTAITQANVAVCLFEMGRIDEAIEINQIALDVLAETLGLDHPHCMHPLSNAAEYLNARGRYAEARRMGEKSAAIIEREFPPDHAALAYPLTAIGVSFVDGGQPELAIPALERALWVRERKAAGAELLGETRFALGRALFESGQDRARGLSLAEQARVDFRAGIREGGNQSARGRAADARVDVDADADAGAKPADANVYTTKKRKLVEQWLASHQAGAHPISMR